MFNQTFVGNARTRTPFAIASSLLLQIAGMAGLILLPLLYTQVLPSAQLKSLLMAPAPPRPLLPKAATVPTRTMAAMRVRSWTPVLTAPVHIPDRINNMSQTAPAPELSGGVPGDNPGPPSPILYGNGPEPAAPPPQAPRPKAANGPLRMGGSVAEANVIHRVLPVYPALAKSARVQGLVEFTAVISKTGRVENLQLLHGHPLLVNAAKEAILQWVYRPTLLNGQPVDVLTTITVNFTLSP